MNLDIFKTPENLPFLYYRSDGTAPGFFGGEPTPSIRLHVGYMPVRKEISSLELDAFLDDVWQEVDNDNLKRASQHQYGRLFAANILRTRIGFTSRRACGNILIVPNSEEKEWFDDIHQHFQSTICQVIVDESLKPNELRATYWRISHGKDSTRGPVDGGIQISPEGLSYIVEQPPLGFNYRHYFTKGFLA
jgi:hypothetical protein